MHYIRPFFASLFVLSGLVLVGTAAAEPAATPHSAATVEAGGATYKRLCEACHQPDGEGMNGMLAAKFSDSDRMQKSDAELLKSVAEGMRGKVGVMPPWKDTLSEKEMSDVLAYIRATYQEKTAE